MRHPTRSIRLVALPGLFALGVALATAGPASAAGTWSSPIQLSTPIPPTDYVAGPAVAVNGAGAEVAAWYDQAADGTQFVHVRTSADGTAWSPATTLGHGVQPAIALSANGRAVAVWVGLDGGGGLMASVGTIGGGWSTPTPVAAGTVTAPQVGIDRSGDALAVWRTSSGVLQRASLPAGGTWSAPQTFASAVTDFDLAVNAGAAAVVGWTTSTGAIVADSGTVLGAWSAAVTLAPSMYQQKGVHVALNNAGQAAAAWRTRTDADATTRTPDGTWAPPTVLVASQASGSVDVAVDGAGDAAAVMVRYGTGSTTQFPLYVSRRPAGGAWGTPVPLSGSTENVGAPRVVADETGTFVAAWVDNNTFALKASTSPPGGTFGAPVAVGTNAVGGFDVAIAPGHAALLWVQGGVTASNEPVA